MCDPILVTLLKMQPHYSQSSRENATPSSGTSPVASYREVPPPPPGGEGLVRRICVETSSRNLEKREQKWVVALTPEQCKHLNDSAKSELRTMLGFSGNEMQVSDDGSSDTDNRSSSNDIKDSESNSDGGADDSDVN